MYFACHNNKGPIAVDHTLGKTNGWYAYANPKRSTYYDVDQLVSSITLSSPTCLEFYYYFVSNSLFKFRVLDEDGPKSLLLRTISEGNEWRLGRVTVQSFKDHNSTYRIVLEIVRMGLSYDSQFNIFALDDIALYEGACQDSSDINDICTFSSGMDDLCGYTIEPGAFSWKLFMPDPMANVSIVANFPLYPVNDHTSSGLGSGYVYVDTSGFNASTRTIMISKRYFSDSPPSARCFEFYFYMNGKGSSSLGVRLESASSNIDLWSRNYNHGAQWWKANINMKYAFSYSIVFEATVGSDNVTDKIALDDIMLREGTCSRLFSLFNPQ